MAAVSTRTDAIHRMIAKLEAQLLEPDCCDKWPACFCEDKPAAALCAGGHEWEAKLVLFLTGQREERLLVCKLCGIEISEHDIFEESE